MREISHIPLGFCNAKLKIFLFNGAAGNPDFSISSLIALSPKECAGCSLANRTGSAILHPTPRAVPLAVPLWSPSCHCGSPSACTNPLHLQLLLLCWQKFPLFLHPPQFLQFSLLDQSVQWEQARAGGQRMKLGLGRGEEAVCSEHKHMKEPFKAGNTRFAQP